MDSVCKKAISVLREADDKFYIDMIDPLEAGSVEAVEANEDGVLIHFESGLWYYMAKTAERAVQLARTLAKFKTPKEMVCAHDRVGIEQVSKELGGIWYDVPCYVAALFRKQPFEVPGELSGRLEFRKMTMAQAPIFAEHYTMIKGSPGAMDYARERLEADAMYGGYVEGKMVGFIGMHREDTMGMLEVFPEYRRQGYGEELEMLLCNEIIKEGRVPFCHILENNVASLHLQKKLGLWLSDNRRVYWMG